MGHGEDHIHMARLGVVAALAVAAMLCVAVHAEVFFQEDFTDGWEDRWVKSKFKSGDEGPWELSAGKFYGDADNKGLKTMTDYRWYDISAKTPTFSNKGKTLVIQYTVKHEQSLDCGGGYIKLAPTSDQDKWGGDAEYSIMFGPDICGYSTKRVHVIFTYKGKNHLIKHEEAEQRRKEEEERKAKEAVNNDDDDDDDDDDTKTKTRRRRNCKGHGNE